MFYFNLMFSTSKKKHPLHFTYLNFFSCLLMTSPCANTNFKSSSVLEGCFPFCSNCNLFGCMVFQALRSDQALESDLHFVLRLVGRCGSCFALLSEILTYDGMFLINFAFRLIKIEKKRKMFVPPIELYPKHSRCPKFLKNRLAVVLRLSIAQLFGNLLVKLRGDPVIK